MKKSILIFALLNLILVPVGTYISPATAQVSDAVNVGNKICPVSGESIEAMGEGYKVVRNGKEYNLCCKMCVKDFETNPEKYIKIVDAELMDESDRAEHDMKHESGDMEGAEKNENHGGHDHHH